jgi:hypothetical protein
MVARVAFSARFSEEIEVAGEDSVESPRSIAAYCVANKRCRLDPIASDNCIVG